MPGVSLLLNLIQTIHTKNAVLGEQVHLWTLEIPTTGIQVLKHVACAGIPETRQQATKILDLGNFTYQMQVTFAANARDKVTKS
jgi:hypothetical protein